MADLKQTNDFERVLHELQKIRRQIDVLEDFCGSKIKTTSDRPRVQGFRDPRTGEVFPIKKEH